MTFLIPFWVACTCTPVGRLLGVNVTIETAGVLSLAVQYLIFGVAFLLDRLVVRWAGLEERIALWRNSLHWASAPLVAVGVLIRCVHKHRTLHLRGHMASKYALGDGLVSETERN